MKLTGLFLALIHASMGESLPWGASDICGNTTMPLSRTQPNVLLVGDSISMNPPYTPGGYGIFLTDILNQHGVAVQHAGGFFSGGQCGDSNRGLLCSNISAPSWLAFPGTFDIIMMNFGLHDLADYAPKGQPSTQIPLSQYGANLATIYKRFATKAKKVIWVSTTPIPDVPQAYGRTYELAVDYNKEALTVLQSLVAPDALLVNDLWSDFISVCGAMYTNCSLQLPANVHLTTAGQEFAAQASAKVILKALGM